jgi:hypothetical protein
LGGLRAGAGSQQLEFDLGVVEGGFVAVHTELGDGNHKFEAEIVKKEGGLSVHTETVEVTLENTGAAPANKRFFWKIWNDGGGGAKGEYLLRLNVIQSNEFLLTHIYWSEGEE